MELRQFDIPTSPPPMRASGFPASPEAPQPPLSPPGSEKPRLAARTLTIALLIGCILAFPLISRLLEQSNPEDVANSENTPTEVAAEFLEAEGNGDIDSMVNLASSSETCFGSGAGERMRSIINKIDFNAFNLELPAGAGPETATHTDTDAVVSGVVDIGYVTTIEFSMVTESDQWKVCGFSIE